MKHSKVIVIDKEIESLLPPLTEDEADRLRISIQAEGCRDNLIVWEGQGILLDGHNRYAICKKHKIVYDVTYIPFPSRELAIEWVVNNQLAKRNLTDERRAYYIGKQYLAQKQSRGGDRGANGPNDQMATTAQKVAEQHGVSEKTVRRSALFATKVDELPAPMKESVLSGKKLCDRCARVGATKDCPRCKELKSAAKRPDREPGVEEPTKRKPSKSGKVLYDTKKFDSAFGIVIREIDRVGTQFDCKDSTEADGLRKQLGDYRKAFIGWYKKVAKQ